MVIYCLAVLSIRIKNQDFLGLQYGPHRIVFFKKSDPDQNYDFFSSQSATLLPESIIQIQVEYIPLYCQTIINYCITLNEASSATSFSSSSRLQNESFFFLTNLKIIQLSIYLPMVWGSTIISTITTKNQTKIDKNKNTGSGLT